MAANSGSSEAEGITTMDALTSALVKIEEADRMFTPEKDVDAVVIVLTLAEINALREAAR